MFAQIIVDVAHANVDKLFTYFVPDDMHITPGHRVIVPFGAGNKKVEGFVLSLSDKTELEGITIKPIARVMEPYPILYPDQIELARWIKSNYRCLLVDALRLMIPAQLRGGRVREKTVRTVCVAGNVDVKSALDSMRTKSGKPRSPRQFEILELLGKVSSPMSTKDISAFIPSASGAISALIHKGLLVEADHVQYRDPYAYVTMEAMEGNEPLLLLPDQKRALDAIIKGLQKKEGVFLLHGVTGSGKTEVYMQAIATALEDGGAAIMLVPEIALTPQTTERFKKRFGKRVAVLHSRLSHGERYDEWRKILLGKADVVVGARSAVFAPLQNLRLIIIDEEHEPSYASEITPRYHAAEVAQKRAKLCGAVVVLGSATPRFETYHRAMRGQYALLELPCRVNDLPMPKVSIVDMREEFLLGNNSIFSAALLDALKRCVYACHQAILFMNRRGYSTFVSCRCCGYVFQCPNCDVSLTYHKLPASMKCHYCGHRARIPDICPQCGKKCIKFFGIGTQKVEEELRAHIKGVKALRMDTDTTRTKNAHHEILAAFAKGEAQVLVGTQMVAKGLDIPNVTLVGVVAADATLFLSDFRSGERTFQLLMQVAGRSGRDKRGGEVIVQTYAPQHPAVTLASKHDYKSFYEREFHARRASMFPPFSVFIRILFTGSDESSLVAACERYLPALSGIIRSGLTEQGGSERELLLSHASAAPIKRREGVFRYHIVLKLARTKHTPLIIDKLYAYMETHGNPLVASIEINPRDMF